MKATLLAVIAPFALASVAHAQETYKKEVPDSLASKAKVTESAAATAAQKRLPKAKIESVELEKSKGRLVYSYDMKTEGKSGVDEVHVSATTGKVLSVAHETAAMEKKEEAGEVKKPPMKPKKP